MSPNRKVIVATRNEGKRVEFAAMLEPAGWQVVGLRDVPDAPEVVEDGETFSANAIKKAVEIAHYLGMPALADDSGLCVDALDGEPGVFSARYAGEGAAVAANNAKLLARLREVAGQGGGKAALGAEGGAAADEPRGSGAANGESPRLLSRGAYICVLALHDPETGETLETQGRVDGWITDEARGQGGFGYDPYFYVPEYGRTMAELTMEEKNAISHRGQALRELSARLAERGEPITGEKDPI